MPWFLKLFIKLCNLIREIEKFMKDELADCMETDFARTYIFDQ